MIAFEDAADNDVLGFESDVIIRWKLYWSLGLYKDYVQILQFCVISRYILPVVWEIK